MNIPSLRVGIGHDTHRLEPGGPLRLGGVDIEFDQHLAGFSDADVLLHAIIDALLGAACLGDIGDMFPNNDEANRDRDSAEMLAAAYERVREIGLSIANLDCTLFAEAPKLVNHKEAIRQRVANILVIESLQVSVKAKTGEGVGSVGRGEAIQAQCVVLLTKR